MKAVFEQAQYDAENRIWHSPRRTGWTIADPKNVTTLLTHSLTLREPDGAIRSKIIMGNFWTQKNNHGMVIRGLDNCLKHEPFKENWHIGAGKSDEQLHKSHYSSRFMDKIAVSCWDIYMITSLSRKEVQTQEESAVKKVGNSASSRLWIRWTSRCWLDVFTENEPRMIPYTMKWMSVQNTVYWFDFENCETFPASFAEVCHNALQETVSILLLIRQQCQRIDKNLRASPAVPHVLWRPSPAQRSLLFVPPRSCSVFWKILQLSSVLPH